MKETAVGISLFNVSSPKQSIIQTILFSLLNTMRLKAINSDSFPSARLFFS